MKNFLITLAIILALVVVAEVGFLVYRDHIAEPSLSTTETTASAAQTSAAELSTEASSSASTEDGEETTLNSTGETVPETTAVPTEAPTEAPTEPEPQEQLFTLTFAGDCTFGSTADSWTRVSGFVQTIGEDYDYPFANVREIFENDEFTMINLEGPLTDATSGAAQKTFAFRGPTAYSQIMTGSSVEAVTLANNHSADYGAAGYESTKTVLEEAGIGYVEQDKTSLYTTENGLVIGLYADAFSFNYEEIKSNVQSLKEAGAEIVICAFHWGTEGSYRCNTTQQGFAHTAIDAGADIVYGHHPHVLQKIEEYGDGIIYYSLGNFAFGGSVFPQDYDSAIIQQEVIRDVDGTVRLGEMRIIPVSISSMSYQNNFQPTPLAEEDPAYARILSKLDGTFTGYNLVVDYDKISK